MLTKPQCSDTVLSIYHPSPSSYPSHHENPITSHPPTLHCAAQAVRKIRSIAHYSTVPKISSTSHCTASAAKLRHAIHSLTPRCAPLPPSIHSHCASLPPTSSLQLFVPRTHCSALSLSSTFCLRLNSQSSHSMLCILRENAHISLPVLLILFSTNFHKNSYIFLFGKIHCIHHQLTVARLL